MRILLAFGLIFAVAGCSTNLNPFNWFGGNKDEISSIAPRGGYSDPVDRRPMIAQISSLSVDRTPYGVILRAHGMAPSIGYHDADLVEVADAGAGLLVFEFRAWPPQFASTTGSAHQREVVAATFLSNQTISGIRQIRVISAGNTKTTHP